MAKSKNHTNHNQNYKAHRNGIHNVKRTMYLSTRGVNQKLVRNTRFARKFDPSIKKPKNLTKKIEKIRAAGGYVKPVKIVKKEVAKKDDKAKAPAKGAATKPAAKK